MESKQEMVEIVLGLLVLPPLGWVMHKTHEHSNKLAAYEERLKRIDENTQGIKEYLKDGKPLL